MKKLFMLCFFVTSLFSVTAQWQPLGAPVSGKTSSIWSSGTNLFVLSADRKSFYKSEDQGATWSKILDFSYSIGQNHKVLIKGDSILIREDFVALHRSIDGGNTWMSIPINSENLIFNVRNRVIEISDSLVQPSYVNRTDDWGLTWNPINSSVFFNNAQSFSNRLAVGNNKLYYLGIQNNLYVNVDSTDYSLVSSTPSLLVDFWAKDSFQTQLSVYQNNHICLLSKDCGVSWNTILDPHNQAQYGAKKFYLNNDTLFYIYPDSVYFQTTDNSVWFSVNGLPTGQRYTDMVKHHGSYYISSFLGGVYKSISLDGPWIQSANFIVTEKARVIETLNNTYFVSQDNQTLATTIDNFSTFQPLNYTVDGVSHIESFDFFNMDGTLFGVFNDTVVKSTDGGANWSKINNISVGTLQPLDHFKLIHEGNTLYLSVYYPYPNSNNHFFLSSNDFGLTWTVIYGDNLSSNYRENSSFMKSGNYFYLTNEWNSSDVLKYSINSGVVNFQNTLAYQTTPINWLKAVNNVLIGAHYQYTGNPDFMFQMYVSTDNGNTWTYGGVDLPAQYINGEFYGNGSQLFAYIPNHGVYYSNNQGHNWAAINNNVDNTKITSLNLLNNELYIYSKYENFWKRTPPAGDIECASGSVYLDQNNDNLYNSTDIPLSNKLVYSSSNYNSVYSHLDGSYNFCVQDFANDTIRAGYYDPNIYFNPEYYVVNQSVTNLDFGIQFHNSLNDVSVVLTPIHEVVTGFSNTYYITVSNLGSTPASGTITFNFDNQLVLQSTSEVPLSSSATLLTWTFANLYPTTQKSFTATFNFPITIPLGSMLHFETTVQPIFNDDVVANNLDSVNQLVYSSYDPNEKTVNLSKYISTTQVSQKSEFVYTVRFQNTGNWVAQNVIILDTISEKLDLSTFHTIEASHNYNVEILANRVVKFGFLNINLTDSTTNEALSHGMIKYAIRCNNTLQAADSIVNTAHIFFDNNEPIKTNSVVNIVETPSKIVVNNQENSCTIAPNPASGYTVIKFGKRGNYQIEILSFDGRIIKTDNGIGMEHILNISMLSRGVYLVKTISGLNVSCQKLIVE